MLAMRIALGNVSLELAKVAACAWRAGNEPLAREAFARGFFPAGVAGPIADLGTGYGDFAIDLARRYPGCSVWGVDSGPILGWQGRKGLPSNLLDCGETHFDDFVRAVRDPQFGDPCTFDLAYILYPNPTAVGAFLSAAQGVVGKQGEIHLLTELEDTARWAEHALTRGGFLVRSAMLPPEVSGVTGYGRLLSSSDTVHWLVARHHRPDEFVIPPVKAMSPVPWPNYLRIGNKRFQERDRGPATEALSQIFGRPIDLDQLLGAVRIDVPGVYLDQLCLVPEDEGAVSFEGYFVDADGQWCGHFIRSLPATPISGGLWISEGYGFNSHEKHGKRITKKMKHGIARSWHQHFLPFLAAQGVDLFQLTATEKGSYAWASLGFDFRNEEVRQELIDEFRVWLVCDARNTTLDDRARSLQHAWDLADFTDENGVRLGRDFLLWRGITAPQGWESSFSLHPSYPGWRRLFRANGNSP